MQKRTVEAQEWQVELTNFDQARVITEQSVQALPAQWIPVGQALGMVTAQNVAASTNVPAFDNSSMDGYAVDSASLLQGQSIAADAVAHISTGMALPPGTNAVVPWEHTSSNGQTITFSHDIVAGQFVRRAGHDIAQDSIVISAQTKLEPLHLGVLASLGVADVLVHRRPRIGVLVTGEELIQPGEEATEHSVFDVNSTLLPALLIKAGAEIVAVECCSDDRTIIAKTLTALASQCDLIVSTGGASVGERDWVRTVVQEDGELLLWRVNVRPGKPFALGRINTTPIAVLPGNPGSVAACTHGFVAPMVRRLMGSTAAPLTRNAVLTASLANDQGRTFLCPVLVDGNKATPLLGHSSQSLHHAMSANGYCHVPPHSIADAGATVSIEMMA